MQEERYTGNGVIGRGFAIYDDWKNKKYGSRRIVNCVQTAVAFTYKKNTSASRVEALAHLFALDLRIKERYDNILRCLVFYFAWRRETDAFKRFMGMLNLPLNKDIREIIEIELERLRTAVDSDSDDPTDKKNRGGRVSEFPGYELGNTARDMLNDTPLDESVSGGMISEKDEEEEIEATEVFEPVEEIKNEKTKENTEGNSDNSEMKEEKDKDAPKRERIETEQEIPYEYKTESNGLDEKPKPSTDKNIDYSSLNGAVDTPPLFEETVNSDTEEEISFIDEVIMDNMIKGEEHIISHNPLEETKQEAALNRFQNPDMRATDKNGGELKDAHLYDKMVLESKGSVTTNPTQNNTRLQIRVEESISPENEFRREINLQFNRQMVLAHKAVMENAMREKMEIMSEEYLARNQLKSNTYSSAGKR